MTREVNLLLNGQSVERKFADLLVRLESFQLSLEPIQVQPVPK